jgi:hypothetical protein
VACLQFVKRLSDEHGVDGAGRWPTIICQTRGVSVSGLGLLVPAMREDDENFFGMKGPVLVTLALPTGAVSARAVAVRYARRGWTPLVNLADKGRAACGSGQAVVGRGGSIRQLHTAPLTSRATRSPDSSAPCIHPSIHTDVCSPANQPSC